MGLLEALAEHVTWSSDRVGPLWPGISKGDVELKWMGKDEQEVVWRRAGQRKCLSFKAGKRRKVSHPLEYFPGCKSLSEHCEKHP